MKIIADQNMPSVGQLFAQYGDVKLLPGRTITSADLIDAELLLVRSVTRVDRQLLEGTKVRFVGSATIGTDHIDLDYLAEAGIQFAHAPGCNAEAVVQYDLSVMAELMPQWRNKKVGIVGCGNVGGRLYKRLCDMGVSCAVYDPLLKVGTIADIGDLASVLACDIICLHTPLTIVGDYPSHHLFNAEVLASLKSDVLLINAGRGAVIDNRALLEAFKGGFKGKVALDVWEAEPELDRNLMDYVAIATPHIAGYSLEGKIRGTEMVHQAFRRWAGLADWQADLNASLRSSEAESVLQVDNINQAILHSYSVVADDQRMRSAMADTAMPAAQSFDNLRRDYPVRREFGYYSIDPNDPCAEDCSRLGFAIL